LTSASLFERTWEAAIELCLRGAVQGRAYRAGVKSDAAGPEDKPPGLHFAVLDERGEVAYQPSALDEQEAVSLFVVARRFVELEDASERGAEPDPPVEEPRRTAIDSLREWGLLDEDGKIMPAFDSDPEPLLGYVVRVGNVFAYGVVKQSALTAGTIVPTGACENAEDARRRATELLYLALVRGATVMGMNGSPAVIDLSAEPEAEPIL
jgi:hypothetical protein